MRTAGKPVKIRTGYLPDANVAYSVWTKEMRVGKEAWSNVRYYPNIFPGRTDKEGVS
jgi:hypothetical protein